MTAQTPRIAKENLGRIFLAGRSASLSSQMVAEVRDALFARKLKPGDFLGTEKELAEKFGTSRIVARDALRSLEALGIVEIRMGKGGGARIANGNARLAAELAAENARPADITKLKRLLDAAERAIDDADEYTRLSREFHLAVAEA